VCSNPLINSLRLERQNVRANSFINSMGKIIGTHFFDTGWTPPTGYRAYASLSGLVMYKDETGISKFN